MELLLLVQQPGGNRYRSIRLSCSGKVSGEESRRKLATLLGIPHHQQSWFIEGTDIRNLVPGQPPFTSGATLTTAPHPNFNEQSNTCDPPLFVFRVLHGPDSQTVFPLTRGSWPLGRQAHLLRIQDPALAPVEGILSVQSTGITYRSAGGEHKIQIGEPFLLGSSTCLIEPWGTAIKMFRDPDVRELDVPAPRSRMSLVLMAILPIVVGSLIAWFTQLWFILFMACASSLLMGIHAVTQGKETGKFRQVLRRATHDEMSSINTFRGVKYLAEDSKILLGSGTRELRVRGKHRDLPFVPTLSHVPWLCPLEELIHQIDLPIATQRMILFQLVRTAQPIHILIRAQEETEYLHLVEPLAVFDCVQIIDSEHLIVAGDGLLISSTRVSALRSSPIQLIIGSSNAPANPVARGWEHLAFDGISQETYILLLSSLAIKGDWSLIKSKAHVVTSMTPHFEVLCSPEELIESQSGHSRDLSMYIGYEPDAERDLSLGLSRHGPHFLCAGTTGSGKSQLLRTMLWSLALRTSPQRLSLILIDFKGGAGLGPLAQLSHTSLFISDLETSALQRSLKYLRADLKKREKLFRSLGVSSYQDYLSQLDPNTGHQKLEYPEVILCIDEFRMLVDSFPEIMNEIMRIATIGRSLGYHLILATQRPQGAISQDIRTNISTVLCLRVNSSQDSYNVLESDIASAIPASKPGSGYIKDSENGLIPFQAPLLTGPYLSDQVNSCSANFIVEENTEETALRLAPLADYELEEFNRGLREVFPLSGYSPVLPELTPSYPFRSEMASSTDQFSIDVGSFEIPESSYQGRFHWVPQDGPLLVVGNQIDRLRALENTLGQAVCRGYTVVCCTASDQTAQELRNTFEGSEAVNIYSLKDIEFIRFILADISQDFPPQTLFILDGLESFNESLIRYPQSESHLSEILQQSVHHQLLVLCTSLAQPRGKWQSLFPHLAFSAHAVKTDATRSNIKTYSIPPPNQFALEGPKIAAHGGQNSEVGTLCWSLNPVKCNDSQNLHHESRPQHLPSQYSRRWKQLPELCTLADLDGKGVDHLDKLLVGIGRGGKALYLPQSRGGFMSISGPRGSGKTTCLKTIASLNRRVPMVYIPSSPDIGISDLKESIDRFQKTGERPVLLIDDLDRLNTDIQHLVLTQKDYFQAVLVAYTPWPRWNSSPILSALNGTSTGVVLQPTSATDLAFYQGHEIPLDLKTLGRIPAGRGVIIDYSTCYPVQVALSDS